MVVAIAILTIVAAAIYLGIYLGYTKGYQDGVQSGSWESVLARAAKINKRTFGKGNQL